MVEIGKPEPREIEIEPIFDPVPRVIPVPVSPGEDEEFEPDFGDVEVEDPDLVPA